VYVLENGSPTTKFKSKRGLRQGDHLPPFLFLIVVEGLLGAVRLAKNKGHLEGIRSERERSKLVSCNTLMILCLYAELSHKMLYS